jgi:small-conductance mechanosensitive channel
MDEQLNLLEQTRFLNNSSEAWLAAGAAFALVFGALFPLQRWICRRLKIRDEQTDSAFWQHAHRTAQATYWWFFFILAVHAASLSLQLSARAVGVIRAATVIVVLLQAALWLNVGLQSIMEGWTRRRLRIDPSGAPLTGIVAFAARVALWAIVFLLILQNLGIEVTALLTGLGIGGVAIALAVQSILGDLFSSLSILVDKPFVLGDFIVVDDMMGTVENIGLKTTRLRSLWGEQLVFPNQNLLQSRIRNYKRMNERRVQFQFAVPLDVSAKQLRLVPDIVREVVTVQKSIRFDRAHLQSFTDLGVNFEVAYYFLSPDYNQYMDAQQEIYLQIVERLAERRIELARPSRVVFVHDAARNDDRADLARNGRHPRSHSEAEGNVPHA